MLSSICAPTALLRAPLLGEPLLSSSSQVPLSVAQLSFGALFSQVLLGTAPRAHALRGDLFDVFLHALFIALSGWAF